MRTPPVLLILLVSLLVAGCNPTLLSSLTPSNPPPPPTCDELAQQEADPQNLSFETIARDSMATQYWPQGEPGLFVATTPTDLDQIVSHIDEEAADALQAVDLGTYLVVAAFSGSKSHGAWEFCITSITQYENDIALHIHLVDSPVAPDITASYYHLVQLPRAEPLEGEVTFGLALTRHEYVYPTGRQRQLQRSDEEVVAVVTRLLPTGIGPGPATPTAVASSQGTVANATTTPESATSAVLFKAEADTLYPYGCTMFSWRVEDAVAVYFDGEAVRAIDWRGACVEDQGRDVVLSVVRQNGTVEEYAIELTVHEETIPFETLSLETSGVHFNPEDTSPMLFLLTEPADVARIENLITVQDRQTLQELDFEAYVVIALFRGWQPGGSYNTFITGINKYYGITWIVEAEFQIPFIGASTTAPTSPYHLVKVTRSQMLTHVRLELQSRVIAR